MDTASATLGASMDPTTRYHDVVAIYFGTGILSVIGCLTLMLAVWYEKALRKHPGSIILWITVSDLMVSLKFLVGAFVWTISSRPDVTKVTQSFNFIDDKCLSESLLGQFFNAASLGWNLMWIVNFVLELYDPLRNTRALGKYYHCFVWAWAAGTTIFVGASKEYGPGADGSCYLKSALESWTLFEGPIVVSLIVGVLSVAYAQFRLHKGLESTRVARKLVLRRHALYVGIFFACWLWPVVHRWDSTTVDNRILLCMDAVGMTSQAFLLSTRRLIQKEVRKYVDWLPCFWCVRKRKLYQEDSSTMSHSGVFSAVMDVPLLFASNEFEESVVRSMSRARPMSMKAMMAHSPSKLSINSDPGMHAMQNMADIGSFSPRPMLDEGALASIRVSPHQSEYRPPELVTVGSAPNLAVLAAVDAGPAIPRMSPSSSAENLSGGGGTPRALNQSSQSSESAAAKARRRSSGPPGWGIGPELRKDISILLLQGIVKAVAVPVNEEDDEYVGGPLPVAVSRTLSKTASSITLPSAHHRSPSLGSSGDGGMAPLRPGLPSGVSGGGPRRPNLTLPSSKSVSNMPMTSLSLGSQERSLTEFSLDDSTVTEAVEDSEVLLPPAAVANERPATPSTPSGKWTFSFPRMFSTGPASTSSPPISPAPSGTASGDATKEHRSLRAAKAYSKRIALPNNCSFVAFDHAAFAKVRQQFDVTPELIGYSLDPAKLATGEIVAKFSEGRSSSFFCKSHDHKFVVKTISATETCSLLTFIPQYVKHVCENPTTLLSVMYGLYCLETGHSGDVYAIVMANVFQPPHGNFLTEVYDLKGSTYHREAVKASESPTGNEVLMDVDFTRRRGSTGLRLGPLIAPMFMDQLRKDVELLKACEFMDYSLLVGIRKMETLNNGNAGGSAHRPGLSSFHRDSEEDLVLDALESSDDDADWSRSDKVRDFSAVNRNRRVFPDAMSDSSSSPSPSSTPGGEHGVDPLLPFRLRTGFMATDGSGNVIGNEVYLVGIIDILEHYTLRKRIEHKLKSLRQRTWEAVNVSATDVNTYAHRFLEFIGRITVYIYLGTGIASLLACGTLAIACAKDESLRKHPGSIILLAALCDLVMSVKFLIGSFGWLTSPYPPDERIGKSFMMINDNCRSETFVGQTANAASLMWNLMWVLNFTLQLYNPVRDTQPLEKYYHLFVWAFALTAGVYVTVLRLYGPGADGSCFTISNESSLWTFQIPTYITGACGLASVAYAALRLNTGTESSRRIRRQLLVQHGVYVGIFILCWVWPMIHRFNKATARSSFLQKMDVLGMTIQAALLAIFRLLHAGSSAFWLPCCGPCRRIKCTKARRPSLISEPSQIDVPLLSSLNDGDHRRGPIPVNRPVAGEAPLDVTVIDTAYPNSVSPSVDTSKLADARVGASPSRRASERKQQGWGIPAEIRRDFGHSLLEGVVSAALLPPDAGMYRTHSFGLLAVDQSPAGGPGATVRSPSMRSTDTRNSGRSPARPKLPSSQLMLDCNAHSLKLKDGSEFTVFEHSLLYQIRSMYGMAPEVISSSLSPRKLLSGEITAKFSEGRSASFFCRSSDNMLVLKTISATEAKALIEFIPAYYRHLIVSPASLLSTVFGVYCMDSFHSDAVYAMLMANVFKPPHGLQLDEIYDLKGSTYKREALKPGQEAKRGDVLMDVDFTRRRGDIGLRLGPIAGPAFLTQLQADVDLLKAANFMDYSLLVGIRRPATPLTTSDAETGVYLSTAPDGSVIGDEVYLFGVIDILQRYTLGKKLEHTLKSISTGTLSNATISSTDVSKYATRFMEFMASIVR